MCNTLRVFENPKGVSTDSTHNPIFYLVLKMLGFNIESEIINIDDRIDAVLKTKEIIYNIEFKAGNNKKAMEQLLEKQYHQKHKTDKRKIQLLGIDFDVENKQIKDWKLADAE